MNNNDIESRIADAYRAATPDVWDSILSDIKKTEREVVPMEKSIKKKKSRRGQLVGLAAALVILVGGIGGYGFYDTNYAVASTVSLDVNPSIEIQVNQKETVLDVIPMNDDAKVIVGDMNFKGSDLEVVVNALVGSMLRNGYITDIENSILISVDGKNAEDSKLLLDKLTKEVDGILGADSINGAVLSQNLTETGSLESLMNQYGITAGKAQLIQDIVDKDSRYTFEALSGLSINELNLILSTRDLKPETLGSTGTASDGAYIGEAKAKAAALSHAGVSESAVNVYKVSMDYEDGMMVYEVEFTAGGIEYEYDIDAASGKVVSYDRDRDDSYVQSGGSQGTTGGNQGASQGAGSGTQAQSGNIGEAKAKAAALSHAGLKESAVTMTKLKLDRDDGRTVYDVEFVSGGLEYDYEIDAASGKVISYSTEKDDSYVQSGGSQGTSQSAGSGSGSQNGNIGEAKAKSVALSHAGLKESAVNALKVKLDRDDGRTVYEVEFKNGGIEYDYEIDASSGKILSYDIDKDD